MGTKLFAVGTITHGDGKDVKTFEDGDVITGLPKEVVKDLVEAGTAVTEARYNRIRPQDDEEVDLDDVEFDDDEDDEDRLDADDPESPKGGGSTALTSG